MIRKPRREAPFSNDSKMIRKPRREAPFANDSKTIRKGCKQKKHGAGINTILIDNITDSDLFKRKILQEEAVEDLW